jgi:hypothetical protein
MEFNEAVLYRMAHGLAAELAEASEHRLSGRWRSNPAAGGPADAIVAEVLRRLNFGDDAREFLAEAVDDALEKRRPRW